MNERKKKKKTHILSSVYKHLNFFQNIWKHCFSIEFLRKKLHILNEIITVFIQNEGDFPKMF